MEFTKSFTVKEYIVKKPAYGECEIPHLTQDPRGYYRFKTPYSERRPLSSSGIYRWDDDDDDDGR